jgi:hypothetical protein
LKKLVAKALFSFAFLVLAQAEAQSVSEILQQGVSLQGAVIPLYNAGSSKPSAVVRVDRAYVDYQRKGFFHIGLFPIGVLDGVTFEAAKGATPTGSMSTVRRWLESKSGQRIELRRVTFLFSKTNRLEAELARNAGGDRWELSKGVRLTSGGRTVQAATASFELAGPYCGRVILETMPRSTNAFVASALTLNASSESSAVNPHLSQ